jgi:predicted Zn-dependent protease
MLDMFRMLDSVTGASGADRLPNWLSTHPAPANRLESIAARIQAEGARGAKVGRDDFLDVLDGAVFGENPREGYFRGASFVHPDMAFRLDYPAQWRTENEKQGVSAMSPAQDAMLQLTLNPKRAAEAAGAFSQEKGIQTGPVDRSPVNGFPAVSLEFEARSESAEGVSVMRGIAVWIEHGGRTFQLLAYAPEARASAYRNAFATWVRSFTRLSDRSILDVQPWRLRIELLRSASSIAELHGAWGGPAPVETLALINGVKPGDALPAGSRVKRIVGQPRP